MPIRKCRKCGADLKQDDPALCEECLRDFRVHELDRRQHQHAWYFHEVYEPDAFSIHFREYRLGGVIY